MKRNNYLLFMALVLALFACDDPYKNSTYQIYDQNPISSYLDANEDYSEWVKVLRYADLYNALNQADVDFTAFVPTNDAVASFYQQMNVSSITDLSKSYAKSMVLYSTVLDTISVQDFVNLSYTTNLSGDKLSVVIDSVNAGEAILDNQAKVIEMGLSVANGNIYVMDGVLKPLVETVYDRVAQNSTYSIMTQALDETGWGKELDILADTTIYSGIQQITARNYTFLAVSNERFAKDSIYSLADLKTKLGAGADVTDSTNALNQYVAYHILLSNYTLENLETFSGTDTSAIWSTKATNQVMMITKDSLSTEKYFINLLGNKACFVTANSNVLAKNGYVHEVDRYLPVWEPAQATVVWDLTNYSAVRSVVGSSIFQPSEPVSSETKSSVASADCYTFEVSASGVGGSTYSYLSYVTCKTNLKAAINYDRLVLNLGYMGTLSMQTPTLVRGKYKVGLSFIYLTDQSFMRTMTDGNGGLMKISFDGTHNANVSPYTTVSSTLAGVYESTLYSEIEFDETAPHTFKIIVMDPSASTNSKFSLQLDAITFTPIIE
jgi:uncharacterized surface protein with fasciclin (FAS1) repeats